MDQFEKKECRQELQRLANLVGDMLGEMVKSDKPMLLVNAA